MLESKIHFGKKRANTFSEEKNWHFLKENQLFIGKYIHEERDLRRMMISQFPEKLKRKENTFFEEKNIFRKKTCIFFKKRDFSEETKKISETKKYNLDRRRRKYVLLQLH